MSTRKLWKVVVGDSTFRPESKAKVDQIYLANARARHQAFAGAPRYADVWVDYRDGKGWQLFETVDLSKS